MVLRGHFDVGSVVTAPRIPVLIQGSLIGFGDPGNVELLEVVVVVPVHEVAGFDIDALGEALTPAARVATMLARTACPSECSGRG